MADEHRLKPSITAGEADNPAGIGNCHDRLA
jgi:hypothetical protein